MGLRSLVSFGLHRLRQLGRLSFYLALLLIVLYFVSITYYSLYCSYRFHRALIDAEHRHLWNVSHGVYEQFTPILIPVCDRPQYLARVLQGLAKVEGINESRIIVSQDCGQATITSLLQSAPSHLRILILRHTPPYFSLPAIYNNEYATSANVKFLLEFAFEHMLANSAILLESDLVPSVDFYRYHQWAYQTLLATNDSKVLSIHFFHLHSRNHSDPYSFYKRGFDSWGWSTARSRWSWLKKHWTKYHGWDTIVSQTAKRDGWICLVPHLSRIRMVGLKGINVNVKTEDDRRQFEEDMYMSDQAIGYQGKTPIIL